MKTKSIITLATLVSIISGCGSVSRDNFHEEFSSPIEQIIYYSSLAGNSHNTQPWYVEIVNDSLLYLKADFSRKLHIVDPDARGLFISLGAFLENLDLAAGSLGYKADIEITAQHKNDSNVAVIHLSKSQKSGYDLNQIKNRRTLRTSFHKTEISKDDLNKLISNKNSEVIYFSSSSEEGKYITEQTLAAYIQQAKDDQAKQELANWMRFSNSDVEKYRDGLTTSGMGITGFSGLFVRNFYKPEDSMKDSFIKTGIDKTKEQTENCGGWLVIIQNEDSPERWIKTGRLYEKLNLACRDMMIGFHPMNQMIEEDNFEKNANEHLSLPGVIQFVARVGYVDEYPPANSVRRSVKEIIRYAE
ncbi:MAG TPA: nitroreductase family protein [Ignavibacteriaceae bacterium]|nr:nitroreductase family protein [Ignavibacteriaceae bacterium]